MNWQAVRTNLPRLGYAFSVVLFIVGGWSFDRRIAENERSIDQLVQDNRRTLAALEIETKKVSDALLVENRAVHASLKVEGLKVSDALAVESQGVRAALKADREAYLSAHAQTQGLLKQLIDKK